MDVIGVLVVDDHEVVRMGLRALLSMETDMRVVGEAGDGDAALAQALRTRPDVIIMDIRMGPTDGIDACRAIKAELPEVGVLMLTSFGEREAVMASLVAGASGFLLKNTGHAELLRAIRAIAAGESLLDPAVTRSVMEALVSLAENAEDPRVAQLTAREREVLRLIADGQSNKEIAQTLVISAATARNHVSHILEKLGMRSRSEAAVFATEVGLRESPGT
jgi:two-component system, NarL family, response regulator DevR